MPKINTVSVPPEFVKKLRAEGAEIRHIRHIPETDEVFISDDGKTFRRADVWLREMITGIPGRDVAQIDPLIADVARHDPILRSIHEARVKDTILHVADYYRPDLARRTPNLSLLADTMVTVIDRSQDKLAALPTVYARWDLIIENMIEWLKKPPQIVSTGPRE